MSKAMIIYWSGTGNTEAMANLILKSAKNAGLDIQIKTVSDASSNDISENDMLVLGCPSMGDEVLEESEFEPFVESIEGMLNDKKVALFGSYGWGDGEWMRNWAERMKGAGANLVNDGLMVNEYPDGEKEDACKSFGIEIAKY